MTKAVVKHELTDVTLISVPDPFGKPKVYSSLGHLTFAEMAAQVNELPAFFWDGGGAIVVTVSRQDGRIVHQYQVPRDCWHLARPKCDPKHKLTVAFAVNLQGGNGGGKNVLQIIALVAVIAVAAWVSAGGLGTLGSFQVGSATFTGAKIAAAAVTVAGTMAIAALSKQPTTPSLGQQEAKSPNTAMAQVNVLAPGAALPRVLGTKLIFPPAICEPLSEHINDSVVTEFVLGLAGPHKISKKAIQFGGHSAPEGATIAIRRGATGDALQRLVRRYGHTDQTNQELSKHQDSGFYFAHQSGQPRRFMRLALKGEPVTDLLPTTHTITLRSASTTAGGPVDEHWLNFSFASLFRTTADDDTEPVGVPIRAQMRRVNGDGTYGEWANWPEFHIVRNYRGQFTFSVRVYWEKLAGLPPAPPSRDDGRGGLWAYTNIANQTLQPNLGAWAAHSYFINPARRGAAASAYSEETHSTSNLLNMVGKKDRWDVYLDPDVFEPGTYEVQIKRGTAYRMADWDEQQRLFLSVTTAAATTDFRPDIFGYFLWPAAGFAAVTPGTPSVMLREGYVSDVAISSVSAVINKQPSPGTDVAVIAIRAKNIGNVGAISCLTSGLVPDWSGSAWVGLKATSNPAPHARYILAGTLNALSVPDALIDDTDFVALRSRCNVKNYQVNADIKGMSVPEALDLTLGCAFAGQRNAEQFGCTYERDRSSEGVVQTFTPRNMANFKISKAFPQLSDGLRCIYSDKNNNYQENSVTVLYGTRSDTIEETRYEGLVTQGEVIRRAKFDLNHSRLRLAEYSWTAPLEFIRCRKGDLVGVQTDVIMVKSGWGRILSKTVNGSSKITSIYLDQTITEFRSITGQVTLPQATFGISIQRKNGDVTTHRVTIDADKRTINLNTPIDDTTDIEEGTLITAGTLGNEFTRLVIREIAPKDSTSADIIAFEEAPQLMQTLEANTAEIADAIVGAPVPRMLDFRYRQNSNYLAA